MRQNIGGSQTENMNLKYQQVSDIYATAVDYDPRSDMTRVEGKFMPMWRKVKVMLNGQMLDYME